MVRRYGEEMAALLEESGASPGSVADLLRGAVRAHLRPEPGVEAELGPDDRVRLGLGSILLCWVVFAVAGLGLYKTTRATPSPPPVKRTGSSAPLAWRSRSSRSSPPRRWSSVRRRSSSPPCDRRATGAPSRGPP